MKKIKLIKYLILFATILVNANCKEEALPSPIPLPPPPPFSQSGTLWCNANVDITVELPINYAILHGSGFGGVGNTLNYNWQKISGPSNYSFENPDSLRTKVLNLNKGVYQFELTVTNNSGDSVKDSMTLKVEDPTSSKHQIFFWDLTWLCPLGCGMSIENINSYVPPNSLFNVYIKRDFSSNWELVLPYSSSTISRYYYDLSSAGGIFIWEDPDVTIYDKPEIKIVF